MSGSKNVRFGLVLSEQARERLDRLARQQGCSRAELIDRALVNLEVVMAKSRCEVCGTPSVNMLFNRCFQCLNVGRRPVQAGR